MKNVFLKSFVIFIVMSLLNAQFIDWSLSFVKKHSGGIGMAPIAVFIECLIASAIGFVTVLIFRKTYSSILKIAVLFEIIYLVTITISGANPFLYFLGDNEMALLDFLLYLNSLIVLLIMYLLHLLYSKIISLQSK
ncbi:hypothetical protein SAMN05443633_103298 [Chryseobacterium arachidis]|uniref:Uncharacterized protein n=1 Tax=Chryseobacterium arachidis TaxID=1416778 RepID=A0A1M4ZX95_9FLAO|nr:hypothetical protein [Chryseobacterium arachidis]SHF22669.1 hypothetical protein SAMN05443633_103298 [Chryseobacterium arachidis]